MGLLSHLGPSQSIVWDSTTHRGSTGESATHLGIPWAQNARGHLLGDVKDAGKSPDDPNIRGYEMGGSALGFHSDGSDLVGLLCLDPGISGGESLISNALLCHNLLVESHP